MSTIGNAGINNHIIFFLDILSKQEHGFKLKVKFEEKYGFVTFSQIRENIYPLHHNNHGNTPEATKEVPNSVTRGTCIPSMLFGRHNSGGSV